MLTSNSFERWIVGGDFINRMLIASMIACLILAVAVAVPAIVAVSTPIIVASLPVLGSVVLKFGIVSAVGMIGAGLL